MSAYLASPLPFAVNQLAGSYLPSAPLDNLLNDRGGMVWRSASSTDFIVVTLSGARLDLIALWATNMTTANSVRVRFSPNADGTAATFDRTYTGDRNLIAMLPAAITATYLRLDFTRGSLPFIEVTRLVLSKALVTEGISTQAEKTYEDQTPYSRGSNYETFDRISRPVVQNWKCTFEGIEEADYYENWDPFLSLGRVAPFVFIPIFPTDYLSKVAILGRLSGDSKVTWLTGVDHRIELQIRGIV
jgi:hypothetical protein